MDISSVSMFSSDYPINNTRVVDTSNTSTAIKMTGRYGELENNPEKIDLPENPGNPDAVNSGEKSKKSNASIMKNINSKDVNKVMSGIKDSMQTEYVDKKTGKNLSVFDIYNQFKDFVAKKSQNSNYENFYTDVAKDFEKQTGIPIKNFTRYRGGGDTFTIGDNWRCGDNGQGHMCIQNDEYVIDFDYSSSAKDYLVTYFGDNASNTGVIFKYDNESSNVPTSAKFQYEPTTKTYEGYSEKERKKLIEKKCKEIERTVKYS